MLLLNKAGADIVIFVDITRLPVNQTKGYPVAVLLGKTLSTGYLNMILKAPNYVQDMKNNNQMHEDEFHNTELKTDCLADFVSGYLESAGYRAYSQSENNLLATGGYNTVKYSTTLPHKTIALIAGMGWIGKHDLLVTPDYGSAISMCTVLTNAPLLADRHLVVSSRCGECTVCFEICPVNAIKGTAWKAGVDRDEIVDVKSCSTCLKCMAYCPWTRLYAQKHSTSGIDRESMTNY